MAKFGWAYVDCDEITPGSGSFGPPHSIQFVTESGGPTTGSAYLTYYTSSHTGLGRDGHTLYLTGTLIVTGAISASSYHIANITQIGTTGSTMFGNTNDDVHIRTGSLTVSKVGFAGTADYILSASAHDESVRVRGFGGEYTQILASTSYVVQSKDYIIGVFEPNTVTITLPGPSRSNTGRLLVIKDELGVRGTGSIIVTGSKNSSYIDGGVSYTMTGSRPAINLYSNGSNWFVF